MVVTSKQICKAAINMALTETREEEAALKSSYAQEEIKVVAVDFGSSFDNAIPKILERAVVALPAPMFPSSLSTSYCIESRLPKSIFDIIPLFCD